MGTPNTPNKRAPEEQHIDEANHDEAQCNDRLPGRQLSPESVQYQTPALPSEVQGLDILTYTPFSLLDAVMHKRQVATPYADYAHPYLQLHIIPFIGNEALLLWRERIESALKDHPHAREGWEVPSKLWNFPYPGVPEDFKPNDRFTSFAELIAARLKHEALIPAAAYEVRRMWCESVRSGDGADRMLRVFAIVQVLDEVAEMVMGAIPREVKLVGEDMAKTMVVGEFGDRDGLALLVRGFQLRSDVLLAKLVDMRGRGESQNQLWAEMVVEPIRLLTAKPS
ncbi:hypothetical protein LTR56_025057 [Elasticomyces elasticus]|nr:hypothetical protein LTR56_025057 [Elasticomyces elasticus]KAK3645020.1 hypothetical protein LTR22_014939 [Elasticomyces elasticus]KAK4905015.1 hypothetical protein LTR49_025636 [Elasticomyces elasticus]KAK5737502.1 hypothetical protein LTS12_025879 [Elasticomyces elasticus]